MEDGIIYTFGSLDTLVLVLEGLAFLFDPDQNVFFASDSGLGVGLGGTLAAMLALLGTIGSYFTTQKIPVHGPLIGLLVYAIIAVPKIDTIFVSDLYTGETVSVSDIPLGVAVIGVGMSTITYNIIQLTERSYSTAVVGGTPYESALSQQNGFLSPLKTLYKLRENIMPAAPGHLIYNIFSYSKYCLYGSKSAPTPPAATFNPDTFRLTTNPLTTYFLDTDLIVGTLMAEFLNPTTGVESFETCGTLNAVLDSDDTNGGIAFFLTDSSTFGQHLLTQITTTDEAMLSQCSTGNCLDASTAITSTEQLIGQILGGVAQSKDYMQARMASDFNKLIISSPSLNAASLTNYASMSREAIESVRLAEVLEGETFLRFMVPAMNFILFIFYAMFPIAMIIMITKGVESFKYLAGYLLIGIWGYSWMPVASVINFITISGVAEALGAARNMLGVNIASSPEMIELAMDQLSTGANLLAATPVITLAIISGALYPLTSVAANSATPKGATSDIARANTPKAHSGQTLLENSPAYASNNGDHNAPIVNNRAMSQGQFEGIQQTTIAQAQSMDLKQDSFNSSQKFGTNLSAKVQKAKQEVSAFHSSNGETQMSAETQGFLDAGRKAQEMANVDVSQSGTLQQNLTSVGIGADIYAGAEGSADVNAIRSLSQEAGNTLKPMTNGNGKPTADNPVMRGSGQQANAASQPASNTPGTSTGTPGPNNQTGNPGAVFPGSNSSGGLPSIGGKLGAIAKYGIQNNQSDADTNLNTSGAQVRHSSTEEGTESNSAIDTSSIVSDLSNTFSSSKSGEYGLLNEQKNQMLQDKQQLENFSEQASIAQSNATTMNASRADLYNVAQSQGIGNTHHENNVKAALAKHLGTDDPQKSQLAYDHFNESALENAKNRYGTNQAENARFMGTIDAYGLATSKSLAMESRGESVLGSPEEDEKMRAAFTEAGFKQFDYMNPNKDAPENSHSSRVGAVTDAVNASSQNPNHLSDATVSKISAQAEKVDAATNPASTFTPSSTFDSLQNVASDTLNGNTYRSLESQGVNKPFQPGYQGNIVSNSPVDSPANFNEAYLDEGARAAYTKQVMGEGGEQDFSKLSQKDQGRVMQQQYGDALRHTNAFNKENYGDTAKQYDLDAIKPPDATGGDAGLYEVSAASTLNYASTSGQNGAAPTHATQQTKTENSEASRDAATRSARRATENGNYQNTHGGSGAEYAELMHEAFYGGNNPSQWNAKMDTLSSTSETRVEGNEIRGDAATARFFESMKVPENFSGSYSGHVATQMANHGTLQEHDSSLAQVADAWTNVVTSGNFSQPANMEAGNFGGYNTNYSPVGVSKLFDQGFTNKVNATIDSSNLPDQAKSDLKQEAYHLYQQERGFAGLDSSADKTPAVSAVNELLKSKGLPST